MPLTENQIATLISALEGHGWQWHDEFICAPKASMWLLRSEPWTGDLEEFHERMSARLKRNETACWLYGAETHHDLVADTRSLVDVLAKMLLAGHT